MYPLVPPMGALVVLRFRVIKMGQDVPTGAPHEGTSGVVISFDTLGGYVPTGAPHGPPMGFSSGVAISFGYPRWVPDPPGAIIGHRARWQPPVPLAGTGGSRREALV